MTECSALCLSGLRFDNQFFLLKWLDLFFCLLLETNWAAIRDEFRIIWFELSGNLWTAQHWIAHSVWVHPDFPLHRHQAGPAWPAVHQPVPVSRVVATSVLSLYTLLSNILSSRSHLIPVWQPYLVPGDISPCLQTCVVHHRDLPGLPAGGEQPHHVEVTAPALWQALWW